MAELLKKENSNISYYIDVEKGVVAAVMEDVRDSIFEEIEWACYQRSIPFETWLLSKLDVKNIPQKLTAKAICHENDEFDLETGMRIARKRLLHKYYRLFRQVLNTINTGIEKDLEPFDDLFLKIIGQDIKFSTDVKNLNSKI